MNQDIDAVVCVCDSSIQVQYVLVTAEIAYVRFHERIGRGKLISSGFDLACVAADQTNYRALRCQSMRDGFADSASTARYDCDLLIEAQW